MTFPMGRKMPLGEREGGAVIIGSFRGIKLVSPKTVNCVQRRREDCYIETVSLPRGVAIAPQTPCPEAPVQY